MKSTGKKSNYELLIELFTDPELKDEKNMFDEDIEAVKKNLEEKISKFEDDSMNEYLQISGKN